MKLLDLSLLLLPWALILWLCPARPVPAPAKAALDYAIGLPSLALMALAGLAGACTFLLALAIPIGLVGLLLLVLL
jgi:hypothetical protein